MAGRRPKPTALKLVAGNPGKRPINKQEPKPSAVGVRMPSWLSPRAKAEWKRVVPELKRMGLVTVVDVGVLAVYCEASAEFREAQEFMRKNGRTYVLRDKDGGVRYVQQFPQVAIARSAAEMMRKIAIEFGFTPASRTKLKSGVPKKDDESKFW